MENQPPNPPEVEQKPEPSASGDEKKSWEEPRLTFVEPKLTRHGKLEKITRQPKDGFFGTFSP